jgi:hypothetical protein
MKTVKWLVFRILFPLAVLAYVLFLDRQYSSNHPHVEDSLVHKGSRDYQFRLLRRQDRYLYEISRTTVDLEDSARAFSETFRGSEADRWVQGFDTNFAQFRNGEIIPRSPGVTRIVVGTPPGERDSILGISDMVTLQIRRALDRRLTISIEAQTSAAYSGEAPYWLSDSSGVAPKR